MPSVLDETPDILSWVTKKKAYFMRNTLLDKPMFEMIEKGEGGCVLWAVIAKV